MKMTSSGGVSSKPIVLGGSKSSSVSVAPSKYVAPLPASCLQVRRVCHVLQNVRVRYTWVFLTVVLTLKTDLMLIGKYIIHLMSTLKQDSRQDNVFVI